mgnify:CR=1 FL=1
MKKLFIKTHGCQMNFYDSEKMVDLLKPHGYQIDENPENADIIVINTCHIREKAVEKTYSELGRIRDQVMLRKEKTGKKTIVAVAGCVAQAQGKEIMKRSPWVDIVVGPQSYQNLPELIAKVDPLTKNNHINIEFPTVPKFDHLKSIVTERGPSAFLTIQEGCDKFCAFCVVPYTRGAEYSRPIKSILDEAKELIDNGVKEITLLGQNVNAWHAEWKDKKVWGLGRLIKELSKIKELEFIRYTTSHPLDMDLELIEAHRDVSKLMPYLHLPIQSGSDNILRSMNRKHTVKEYIKVIEKVRHYNPNIALSGDFIVGFPGETDKDFLETLQLVKDIKYGQSYSFKYSSRPGTPAANREEVCESLKKDRLAELQLLLSKQQMDIQKSMIGKEVKVLFEKPGRLNNQMGGKSEYLHAVHVIGSSLKKGDIKSVKIINTEANSLGGVLI